MTEFQINCSISSDYNEKLLREWARLAGRPLADLGSALLEEGLNVALRENRIPTFILESVNQRFEKHQ